MYEQFRDEFISWSYKHYTCPTEDAKEIWQQAVVVLYENVMSGKLTHLNSNLKTYLFAVGKNKLMERHRAEQKLTRPDGARWIATADEDAGHDVREAALNLVETTLDALGDPCKSLLELYYYQRLIVADIAARLGYKNADAAKTAKYKCLKRLRKLYTEAQVNTHE